MNEKQKVYLSGKMRGLDEEVSRKLFADAQNELDGVASEVVNPWDLEDEKARLCNDWADFILFDLPILKKCDGIYMLRNWKDSWGAKVEFMFANGCGIDVKFQSHALSGISEEKSNRIRDDFRRFLYHEALQQHCSQEDVEDIVRLHLL